MEKIINEAVYKKKKTFIMGCLLVERCYKCYFWKNNKCSKESHPGGSIVTPVAIKKEDE